MASIIFPERGGKGSREIINPNTVCDSYVRSTDVTLQTQGMEKATRRNTASMIKYKKIKN